MSNELGKGVVLGKNDVLGDIENLGELLEKISELVPFEVETGEDNFGFGEKIPEIKKIGDNIITIDGGEFYVNFTQEGKLKKIIKNGFVFLEAYYSPEDREKDSKKEYIVYDNEKIFCLLEKELNSFCEGKREGFHLIFSDSNNFEVEKASDITGYGDTIDGKKILLFEEYGFDKNVDELSIRKGIDMDLIEYYEEDSVKNNKRMYLVFEYKGNNICFELNDYDFEGRNEWVLSKSSNLISTLEDDRFFKGIIKKAKIFLIEYGLIITKVKNEVSEINGKVNKII